MKKVISTTNAPAAIGPYSQAIEVNGMVFASGQIPVNPATGEIPEGIEAQAEQVLNNVKNLLAAAGASMEQVVKTTVFIQNMDDFGKVNEIYAKYFEGACPARSCVEVSISHRMEELFRISDRVTIIRDGAYVGTKKTSETNANELVAMMVGRELESFYARDYNDLEHAETALEVKNLTCEGVFSDISFRVRKGEILGFAGLVGAGRSEIMECIFGARKYQSGTILLNGKEVRFTTPIQAIKAGIGLVPEDRKKQGLVLGNTVVFRYVSRSDREILLKIRQFWFAVIRMRRLRYLWMRSQQRLASFWRRFTTICLSVQKHTEIPILM